MYLNAFYDCAVSLPSTNVTTESHIYADPSSFLSHSRADFDPVPQLDAARITIEKVIGKSTSSRRQQLLSCTSRTHVHCVTKNYLFVQKSGKMKIKVKKVIFQLKPII